MYPHKSCKMRKTFVKNVRFKFVRVNWINFVECGKLWKVRGEGDGGKAGGRLSREATKVRPGNSKSLSLIARNFEPILLMIWKFLGWGLGQQVFSYFNIYQIFWKVLLCSATMCTETSTHFWGWIKLLVYTLPAFRAPFNNWQMDLWRENFLHLLTRRYLNCVSQRARLFVTLRYNATRA